MNTNTLPQAPLRLPHMLTTAEAAGALRITPATVCSYVRQGWLDASLVGRRLLIDRDSVLRLMKAGTPQHDHLQNP